MFRRSDMGLSMQFQNGYCVHIILDGWQSRIPTAQIVVTNENEEQIEFLSLVRSDLTGVSWADASPEEVVELLNKVLELKKVES